MRSFLVALIVAITLVSCSNQKDQYSIIGSIKGMDNGKVYLRKSNGNEIVDIDSVNLDNGKFRFVGKITHPEMWQITLKERLLVPLFVENSTIEVQIFPDSLDKSTVNGSVSENKYNEYINLKDSIDQKMDNASLEWKKAQKAGDILAMKQADSIATSLENDSKKLIQNFAKANPATTVTPFIVMRNSWQFELPELEEIVNDFDASIDSCQYTQSLKKRVEILRSVQIGQIAPDFIMNDSLGNPVSLSSLKGKVLLVDFWASWCKPCRAENPNVVGAYKAYYKKGFDILGCSFDKNREKWLKAVKDDQLSWHHVSDLKGWANAAGKLYGINSIPANVLLDKDQKIIARNLRGDDLIKKLAEVFKAKN